MHYTLLECLRATLDRNLKCLWCFWKILLTVFFWQVYSNMLQILNCQKKNYVWVRFWFLWKEYTFANTCHLHIDRFTSDRRKMFCTRDLSQDITLKNNMVLKYSSQLYVSLQLCWRCLYNYMHRINCQNHPIPVIPNNKWNIFHFELYIHKKWVKSKINL